jgi:hypothetical protein
VKALVGFVVVTAHAIAFVAGARSCDRPELAVVTLETEDGFAVGKALPVPGVRESSLVEGHASTLGFRRFSVRYRGGFERTVGHATWSSRPPDDPPACVGRVVVGQRLLDDGKASPDTIAGELARSLAAELAGESVVGAGRFERVARVSLRWTELAKHPEDLPLVGGAQAYVRVTAALVFERVTIPLILALIPRPSATRLDFEVVAIAQLELDNRVLQWMSDKLGGDRLATRLARREIDASLVTALAPPPPFELPGGQQLTFGYCDGPFEVVDGVSGALPFGIATGVAAHAPRLRPPRRLGPPPRRIPLAPGGTVAIDLDVDGANELLFELWRGGFLDRQLADAGLDRRFNDDPLVVDYLSLRISPPRLAHPPVIASIVGAPGKLGMFADARVTIRDGELSTTGRIWGGLAFSLAGAVEPMVVELSALELSCERATIEAELAAIDFGVARQAGDRVTTLVPCYSDLVGALRDRGAEFQGELTRTFVKLLDDIFVDQRVGATGLSADLVIRGVRASAITDADNGSIHLELDAALAPKP